jgi:hypothetical protein
MALGSEGFRGRWCLAYDAELEAIVEKNDVGDRRPVRVAPKNIAFKHRAWIGTAQRLWNIFDTGTKILYESRFSTKGIHEQLKPISRVLWYRQHQNITPARSMDWAEGPSPPELSRRDTGIVSRLDKVQLTRHSEEWKNDQDARDTELKLKLHKELRRVGKEKEATRLNMCGNILGMKVCTKCGHQHADVSQCMQWHLCPTCARIRSRKLQVELRDHVRGLKPISGYGWKLLTLPVKTDDKTYRAALAKAVEAFSQLNRMVLKKPGSAAFRSVEFGPLDGNVHVHCLYYGPRIPKQRIADAWLKYTGDSYIVDIRAVRDKKSGKILEGHNNVGLGDAIDECTKYVTKMAAVEPAKLVEFWLAMRGRRMTQRYGGLLGMRTEKQLLDQPDPCPMCAGFEFRYELPSPELRWRTLQERAPP